MEMFFTTLITTHSDKDVVTEQSTMEFERDDFDRIRACVLLLLFFVRWE